VVDLLRINALDLLRRPGSERRVDLEVSLDDLGIHDDPRFADGAELQVRLRLEALSDGVVVDGTVHVPWVGTCRRCLQPVAGVLEADVHELYQRTLTDPDAFPLEGDQLDLRPLVREVALLDAPATPVCRPDCAGLCPTCGVDRNENRCGCTSVPSDPRWDALAGLGELLSADEPGAPGDTGNSGDG